MDVAYVDAMIRRCKACLKEHNSPVVDGICRDEIKVLSELRLSLLAREAVEP